MADLLKRLHEQRMAAIKAAREIAERGADGKETPEDEVSYTRANEDIDRLGVALRDERKRLDDEREFADAMEASARKIGLVETGSGSKDKAPPTWREEARSAIRSGTQTSGGTFERLPDRARVAEMRTLLAGSSTHGPELIKETLVDRLFIKLFDDCQILSAGATILRTDTGELIKFPRLTSLGTQSQSNVRRSEGQQIQKSAGPLFDQVTLNAWKYGEITQASREVIEDAIIDIEGLMGTVLGRNMANYLGQDLLYGAGPGSSQPTGVATIVPTGNKVTGATGKVGKPSNMDDLLDVMAKLKPTYRRQAKWYMHDLTTFTFRKFKLNFSTGENAYAWQPGLVPGAPDTLMGYPIMIDPFMTQTGLGNLSVLFADFSMYYVRLVGDTRVEWSTEYAWDTDLVSVKAVLRADGATIDDTAFAGFVGGAS